MPGRRPRQYAYVGRGSGLDGWRDDYVLPAGRGTMLTGRDLSVTVAAVCPARAGIGVAAVVAYPLPAS